MAAHSERHLSAVIVAAVFHFLAEVSLPRASVVALGAALVEAFRAAPFAEDGPADRYLHLEAAACGRSDDRDWVHCGPAASLRSEWDRASCCLACCRGVSCRAGAARAEVSRVSVRGARCPVADCLAAGCLVERCPDERCRAAGFPASSCLAERLVVGYRDGCQDANCLAERWLGVWRAFRCPAESLDYDYLHDLVEGCTLRQLVLQLPLLCL